MERDRSMMIGWIETDYSRIWKVDWSTVIGWDHVNSEERSTGDM